jgi:hypothetical protein
MDKPSRRYVRPDKKEVIKCVDAIFDTCDGRFTEVTLCASVRLILDTFEKLGAKPFVIHRGGKGVAEDV